MRRFSIQIPQPCPQSWNDMQPDDTGRFCASCQKTVVDYTSLSDQELIRMLGKPTVETRCGRLRDDQLNRLLVGDTAESNWQRWLSLLTMGCLGLQTTLAQQHLTKSTASTHPTQTSPAQPSFTPIVRADQLLITGRTKPLIITGRVLLRDTADIVQPLANAYVTISRYNSSWHSKTDSTGEFTLTVTTLEQPTAMNIWVSGGHTLRSSCQIRTTGVEKTIRLSDGALMMYPSRQTVDVSGGGITIIPAPTRWQRFWRSLFHQQPRQNG